MDAQGLSERRKRANLILCMSCLAAIVGLLLGVLWAALTRGWWSWDFDLGYHRWPLAALREVASVLMVVSFLGFVNAVWRLREIQQEEEQSCA